jgi:polyisoprenoid-binding protein YceI
MTNAAAVLPRQQLSWVMVIVLACCGATVSAAQTAPSTPASFSLAAGSRIWLTGDSTLHAFTSTATNVTVSAQLAASASEVRAAVAAGALKALAVTVPIDGLKSGDTGLDKNARKALKQETASSIVFTLASYTSEESKDGSLLVKAHGQLAIAGVAKEVALEATCQFTPNAIQITGTKDILMTDFGIKPPTMMLGAVKTADKVVVHFDLKLQAADTTLAKR